MERGVLPERPIRAEEFYDALRMDTLIPEALKMDFSPRILMMLMLQHLDTRFLRCKGSYSNPILSDRSILAGSRHSNNIAKTVVYAVIASMLDKTDPITAPIPRAWFDDISLRIRAARRRGWISMGYN